MKEKKIRYKNHTSMHIFKKKKKKTIPFKTCKITVAYTHMKKKIQYTIHNWIITLERKTK